MTITGNEREAEQAMQDQSSGNPDHIDRVTSASICHAIGERLRRDLGPEENVLPSRLQMLLDEMQRRDTDGH